MTHSQSIKYAAEIKALQEGKVIQQRAKFPTDAQWQDVDNPLFDDELYDYRIKPEPLDGYVNVYEPESSNSHLTDGLFHYTQRKADTLAGPTRIRCVHVREVVE